MFAVHKHRFSVDEYHRLSDVFDPQVRTELIAGDIIHMHAIGSRHAAVVRALDSYFHQSVGSRALVSCQNPLQLNSHSEPEPDVVLLNPREDYYADSHPLADDALLVIEVADTSLEYDRDTKLPLYSTAGLPEVWIIDLAEKSLEVYRNQVGGFFASHESFSAAATVRPLAFPDIEFSLSCLPVA